jgi:predicted Zn-dependent protease
VGYWAYYLIWILLAYAARYPYIALVAVIFFLLRGVLPDPFVLLRTAGHIGALRRQILANPANITARRDLAMIYLERLRPRAARTLLDEARQRDPDNPELLYLTGVARLRTGDLEGCLEPLVRAVEIDPRVRFGEPYLCAAYALTRLRRSEEAEDALERYVAANSSSVEGYVRLSLLRTERGDREGARTALREALDTWRQIPSYQKRTQLGWWFRAQLARIGL